MKQCMDIDNVSTAGDYDEDTDVLAVPEWSKSTAGRVRVAGGRRFAGGRESPAHLREVEQQPQGQTEVIFALSPAPLPHCPFSRHSAHVNGFSEPIAEEGDGNGNVSSGFVTSRVGCTMSPALPRHEPGLIDDEILDQPMLVGDTFSHSESLDCLSAVRRMEFEAEKATLISIDRSLIEDNDTL
ncbi:hypothetical protein OESDEN_07842 [Oesophagostomum dentatum]|uniref:Uncharacterized protein n=1 Tax=Oesophagostomum dentatum TaxID=61180 RepID=A0A0B1TA73_OESDE|nr:hypothetical protein OESDEN_07842 [Oesophagostomum dentatum]